MELNKAVKILRKEFPFLIPFSYLNVPDGIILNTKSLKPRTGTEPAQYLIKDDSSILPVNPLNYNYGSRKFTKIPFFKG